MALSLLIHVVDHPNELPECSMKISIKQRLFIVACYSDKVYNSI